ncbi:MAG TPA: TIGR01777 family oxidoreductase [candidate division Zixibacteria bacterium]
MRVIITGATGFIGRALAEELAQSDYEIVALSRNPQIKSELNKISYIEWDAKNPNGWTDYVDGAYAVVNLTGENISAGRWTRKRKEDILHSRLNAGKAIIQAVKQVNRKPKVIVQASAIGYYGSRGDEALDESSSPGTGYLPEVAQKWEISTQEVETLGVRHVIIRTGIVLGKDGGALPRLIQPFRFFVGGPLGSGKQWFSWIHLEDEIKAIRFLMENENLNGAFNLTAPSPLMMKDFCKILGRVMHRPCWLKVPGFMLRLIMGEMAEALLITGQRVQPKRLLETGYQFLYPEAELALSQIFSMG